MQILVWGLGYVGTVTAACLARLGHQVIGIELNEAKVDAINSGTCTVREPGLERLVAEQVAASRLSAVTHGGDLVAEADASLICVGTRSAADGTLLDDFVRNVAREIGEGLQESTRYHVVVVRRALFPGTTRSVIGSLVARHSGKRLGSDFGLVSNPEFLREATALTDFAAPPYTVIGEADARAGDVVEAIYKDIDAPVHRVVLEEAELLKLVCNAFQALKIGFANEVGRVCSAVGLDSHAVMGLVCADRKLNISATDVRPGFAFGGSCLTRDLRSLGMGARRLGVDLPIVDAILVSNRAQIEEARLKVHELGVRRVTILGLSFKAGTDDLRESPVIGLIRRLWQDGVDVVVHDPDVEPDMMVDSHRDHLERQLPQIHSILRPRLKDALRTAEAVVVTQKRPEFIAALHDLPSDIEILDLVRLFEHGHPPGLANYRGISWSPSAPVPTASF